MFLQKFNIFSISISNFFIRFIASIFMIFSIYFFYNLGIESFLIFLTLIFIRAIYEIILIIPRNTKLFYFNIILILSTFLLYFYNLIKENYLLLFLITLIASLHDIGGYIYGNLFGNFKIVPNISPKKTLEGFIGSLIFVFIGIEIFKKFFNLPFNNYFQELIAVFLAFFGDLYFSKIKRIFNVKDYQVIIPGHGGILDRIDSSIFLAWYISFLFLVN